MILIRWIYAFFLFFPFTIVFWCLTFLNTFSNKNLKVLWFCEIKIFRDLKTQKITFRILCFGELRERHTPNFYGLYYLYSIIYNQILRHQTKKKIKIRQLKNIDVHWSTFQSKLKIVTFQHHILLLRNRIKTVKWHYEKYAVISA